MQATFNSISGVSGPQSSTLLRMRDVVATYNVAETTIRRATADGSLSCLTLPSGHRRFRESDVLEWLGICQAEGNDMGGAIPVAAVIRVSSDGQNRRVGNSDKSSLEHQEERVREYVNGRWGSKAKVTWYRRVASGMNFENPEFLQLIKDILAGRFKGGYIIATDFTRICRFGIKLVEFIAQQGGCQIVYTLSSDEDKSLNESLTDEILSILTHYTAKASGQKNKSINETKMDESQLKDAYRWHKSGFSYRAIADRLAKEGRNKDEKGRTVSRNVVFKRLQENWATLEKLYSDEATEKNSFLLFVEEFVRKSKSDKTRLSRKRLMEVYETYCRKEGLPILSSTKVGIYSKKLGWQRKFDTKGSVVFAGLSLNTNKG